MDPEDKFYEDAFGNDKEKGNGDFGASFGVDTGSKVADAPKIPTTIDGMVGEATREKPTEKKTGYSFGKSSRKLLEDTFKPGDVKQKPKEEQHVPGYVERTKDAYHTLEIKDKLEGIARVVSMQLQGMKETLFSEDCVLSEDSKEKYLNQTKQQTEELKQNRLKLTGIYDELNKDIESLNQKQAQAISERNGIMQETREGLAEYERVNKEISNVKANMSQTQDPLKLGDLESDLHERQVAGGNLEDELFEANCQLEQYVTLLNGNKVHKEMLSRNKLSCAKEIRWLGTTIIQLEQGARELQYIFSTKANEVGPGASYKTKMRIRGLQANMEKLRGLFRGMSDLSRELDDQLQKESSINNTPYQSIGSFLPEKVKEIAQKYNKVDSIWDL